MSKKIQTNRGASIIRLALVVAIAIALLIFFNATSVIEIQQLFISLGTGAVAGLKIFWYQIIMPVVNFFLTILGRVIR